jgi:lysozyme family protein
MKALTWKVPAPQPAAAPKLAPAPAPIPAPSRFPVCLPFTLAQECPDPSNWSDPRNFSNDLHDPGGATMCGITQAEYDIYRKAHDLGVQPVQSISQTEGDAIYQASYWQPISPLLPVGLDLSFFDSSVNMGGAEAVRILQTILGGLTVDGVWGPQTAAAVGRITTVVGVIKAFTARRQAVYESFSTFQYFGTDWTRRTSEIGAESVTMASAAPVVASAAVAALNMGPIPAVGAVPIVAANNGAQNAPPT